MTIEKTLEAVSEKLKDAPVNTNYADSLLLIKNALEKQRMCEWTKGKNTLGKSACETSAWKNCMDYYDYKYHQPGETRVSCKGSHMHKIQRRNVWRSYNINSNKGRAENSERNATDSNWRYRIFVKRRCRNKIKRNEKIINSKTPLSCGVFLI